MLKLQVSTIGTWSRLFLELRFTRQSFFFRSRTVRECNTTHDAVCECESGFYWDDRDRTCRHCETCNVGFGALNQCTRSANFCFVTKFGFFVTTENTKQEHTLGF